jgi:hypothetical protein
VATGSSAVIPIPSLPAAGPLSGGDFAVLSQGSDVAVHATLAIMASYFQTSLNARATVDAASPTGTNVNVASAPASLDGVSGVSGVSRWLLKNNTIAAENGIYDFHGTGAALTRSSDMDTWPEVPGFVIPVAQGTQNADSVWIVTSDFGGTLGTTPITFAKFWGTNLYQPYAAKLSAIVAQTWAANKRFQLTGVNTITVVDDWVRVKLATDFSTTLATDTAVTGLKFTPAANKQYEIRGKFILKTSVATDGARPGVSFPTGLTWQAGQMAAPNSAVAGVQANFGPSTTFDAPSTGLPDTTNGYLGQLNAMILAGVTPSGDFQITLATETGGTTATMLAGSYVEYRIIP